MSLQIATDLCARGQFGAATELMEDLLRNSPGSRDAWLMLARLRLQSGNCARALEAARAATDIDPAHSDALYVRGRIHKALGDVAAAEASYRQALVCDATNADALTSLGVLARAAGRTEEAVALYRRVLELRPGQAAARTNLVNALATLHGGGGLLAGADAPQAASTGISGGFGAAVSRERLLRALATHLTRSGRPQDAFIVVQEALQESPGAVDLWLAAGTLALEMGLMAASLGCCEQAMRLDPNCYPAANLARRISVGSGLHERAQLYSERVWELSRSDDTRLTRKLALPAIAASATGLRAARERYEEGLDEILASAWRPADPFNCLQLPNFFLAYHGECERELQMKAARMCLHAVPDLDMTAAHCQTLARRPGRIRVGFISRHLSHHSIGKTSRGLIEKLDRGRFEVYVLRITPSVEDEITRRICAAADRAITLDKDVRSAREQIAALQLEVLFYQDIGMEPTSWFLAFARLAPVQCVSFGHPSTTGIPNMDYFISNDLFEVPDAAAHYSERLFLLHDLPTLAYYYRPPAPRGVPSKLKFGLPADASLYLCPQTLFKLHPDFDACLAGILRGDPRGRVVLIEGDFDEWTRLLRERFARSMPDVTDRILFLPGLPQADFLELLAAADVVLDPVHFNGMNSSLESFAVGTPVVTLPTRLQRGRHTQAMYRKMEILDCIASSPEEYIRIAVRLGTDPEYREELRSRIQARNGVLFEDSRVVREFERFFCEAVDEYYATPGVSGGADVGAATTGSG